MVTYLATVETTLMIQQVLSARAAAIVLLFRVTLVLLPVFHLMAPTVMKFVVMALTGTLMALFVMTETRGAGMVVQAHAQLREDLNAISLQS
jgi:hypothetical protein